MNFPPPPRSDQTVRVCPRCGGADFIPVRSAQQKVLFGVGSLLMKPEQIKCVNCGARYY